MTAEQLRKAQARHQRAFARSEATRADRDAVVRAALDAGWTHARIADATGLTRGRIGQIAMTRARPGSPEYEAARSNPAARRAIARASRALH